MRTATLFECDFFDFCKMRDNTDRYKRFADAYNKAYYDSKPDERKKTLDDEWRNRWKSSESGEDFEIRIAQLVVRSQRTTIFRAFTQAKKLQNRIQVSCCVLMWFMSRDRFVCGITTL